MRRQPRIGLVGVGTWGAFILRDLVELGAEVVAVARSPQELARCRAGGAAAVVGAATDLPRDLDGYVVATPVPTHAEIIRTLMPRSGPIFVEKPMTDGRPTRMRVGASPRSSAAPGTRT